MYDTSPGIQSPYRHHVKVNGTGSTTRYTHSTYHAKTILQDEHRSAQTKRLLLLTTWPSTVTTFSVRSGSP